MKEAVTLAWLERQRSGRPVVLTSLAIGNVRILNLPGEPFIDYQFAAQEAAVLAAPNAFVLVGGYTDGGPGYICTKDAFAEGGYEPTASNVEPESEQLMRLAIRELMDFRK